MDEDFNGLVLTPDKKLLLFEGGGVVLEIEQPYAIGSGMPYALAAMKAGVSAEKSLQVAMEMDVYSGGDVTKLVLPGTEDEVEVKEHTQQDGCLFSWDKGVTWKKQS